MSTTDTPARCERDALARTIAFEFGDPRDHDLSDPMGRFVRTGEIAPGLMKTIETAMMRTAVNDAGSVGAADTMRWVGWLWAYVLETGAVDRATGWAVRTRGPVPGWGALPRYNLTPEDPAELPAWADPGVPDVCRRRLSWRLDDAPDTCDADVTRAAALADPDEPECELHRHHDPADAY